MSRGRKAVVAGLKGVSTAARYGRSGAKAVSKGLKKAGKLAHAGVSILSGKRRKYVDSKSGHAGFRGTHGSGDMPGYTAPKANPKTRAREGRSMTGSRSRSEDRVPLLGNGGGGGKKKKSMGGAMVKAVKRSVAGLSPSAGQPGVKTKWNSKFGGGGSSSRIPRLPKSLSKYNKMKDPGAKKTSKKKTVSGLIAAGNTNML
jgi:hypothetical protein